MQIAVQFDRERIPERVVHARGASAKGFFEVRGRFQGMLPQGMLPLLACDASVASLSIVANLSALA